MHYVGLNGGMNVNVTYFTWYSVHLSISGSILSSLAIKSPSPQEMGKWASARELMRIMMVNGVLKEYQIYKKNRNFELKQI